MNNHQQITDHRSQIGFTLIELLVVIAIIGLLASVISIGLGNARLKSRDAKRLSDMQQVKTGLDLYFNHSAGYPDTAAWASGNITCDTVQILRVPADPGLFIYTYTPGGSSFSSSSCGGDTVYENFKVQFELEGETSLGSAGTYYMSTRGFSATAPF